MNGNKDNKPQRSNCACNKKAAHSKTQKNIPNAQNSSRYRESPSNPKARENKENTSRAERIGKWIVSSKVQLIVSFGILALIFAVCMIINISIGVREIEVIGAELCTEEEILSAAGVEVGKGYFSYNTSKAEKKVKETFPNINSINITRSVFGKVKITVSEEKAFWYVESYGEYFALSEDLHVIKSDSSRDRFVQYGLVRLDLPEVKSVILNRPMEFKDGDRDVSYIFDFLDAVTKTELYAEGRLDQIEVETKFEIFMVFDCKYRITFGNSSDVEKKLLSLKKTLGHTQFEGEDTWEINISDPSNISARKDYELNFSYLMPSH